MHLQLGMYQTNKKWQLLPLSLSPLIYLYSVALTFLTHDFVVKINLVVAYFL